MPFGFFSRLQFRARDSILEGAMEAAQILEHGPDDKTFRTETVEAIDAEEGGALPRLTAAKTTSGGHADTSNTGQKKPPASSNATGSPRRPRRTAKTEAMFDVSEDSLP